MSRWSQEKDAIDANAAGDASTADFIDVVHHDTRTFLGEALGDALTEPRSAAGYDRHFAAEPHALPHCLLGYG